MGSSLHPGGHLGRCGAAGGGRVAGVYGPCGVQTCSTVKRLDTWPLCVLSQTWPHCLPSEARPLVAPVEDNHVSCVDKGSPVWQTLYTKQSM